MLTLGSVVVPTLMVIGVATAVAFVTHVAVDVNATLTTSPSERAEELNVAALVPTFEPLTVH